MNGGTRRRAFALYLAALVVVGIAANGNGFADLLPTTVESAGTTIPRLTTVPPETTTSTSTPTSTSTTTSSTSTTTTTAAPVTTAARVTTPTAPATTAATARTAVTPDAATSCPDGTYTNVDGNRVCRPYASDSAPPGATARCRNGEYSFSQNRQGTCSGNGGVAAWL
ncbi:MAG TPA: DUF3761 domain-containing protein [Acidimicrobiales bacterium]